MEKLLPVADASALSLSYLNRITVRSQIIYLSTLLIVIITIFSLPFIKVDISVKSNGILEPSIEKNDLLIPANGHISFIKMKDNMKVRAGDTLLKIDPTLNEQQHVLVKSRINDLNLMLNDIGLISFTLTKANFNSAEIRLASGHYAATWQQFLYQMQAVAIRKDQAGKEFKRNEILFKQRVLSASEFEKYQAVYDQNKSDYNFTIKQYLSQCQAEANQFRAELNTLYEKMADWKDQQRYFTLTAPINGSIQNLTGLNKGGNVFANQKIAELSPDTSIEALCYVNPSDIGLLRKQQRVRFMIDAFNYNQWGSIEGKVTDIGEDIVLTSSNQPVFKVKCTLKKNFLQLSNGYKGYLKKGMTLKARFLVTRRSLFQLLYDQVDNWLNPATA